MSGAALEQLARESRRRARGLNRAVVAADDLLACLPETRTVPPDRLAILSIHEVGHAIVALAFGRTIETIRIADRYRVDAGQGFEREKRRVGRRGGKKRDLFFLGTVRPETRASAAPLEPITGTYV